MFPKGKIVGWLSWLAAKMRERSQSVFLVEGIQPSWLDTGAQLVAYRTVAALSAGLIFGLISGLILGLTSGLGFGLTSGLISGLILLAGVSLGCLESWPVENQIWCTMTLRRSGYTPRKFVKFLDHCSKLILLKKVGGGYIFIHRMLLEYFADLTPESMRTTGSKWARL